MPTDTLQWQLKMVDAATEPAREISHAASNFYGTEIEIWAGLGRLAVLKNKFSANYEQLLRAVFSCFQRHFFSFLNIVASSLKSCMK